MRGQRGSILVGVIGLSAVVSAALAAFLVMASSSNGLQADSEAETRLHYAAESAMSMGLRWLRTYPVSKTSDVTWPAAPVVLNSAGNNFTLMDGAWVKVIFLATPGEFQDHKIRCFATLGSGRDTLEINYFLALTNVNNPEFYNGNPIYSLSMAQWRETIHPGR
jgi:hypothetical protein